MNNQSPFIEIEIINHFNGKSKKCNALVDTGSSTTCIPKRIIYELDFQQIAVTSVALISGTIELPIYSANIRLENSLFSNQSILGIENEFPLLGWDILQNELPILEPTLFKQISISLSYIKKLKEHNILILGPDSEHMDRLRLIQKRVEELGYKGIIVKDQADIEIQSIEEKVNMFASLSRFIICENSFPSGHIDELKICSINRYVTVILQQRDKGSTWMQTDYPVDFPFIKILKYSNLTEINAKIDEAVKWADSKLEERRILFKNLYTW